MRIVVAISGASGVRLGEKFIKSLPSYVEKHIVISKNARIVFEKEENVFSYPDFDISAPVSSGSFKTDAMAIIPCSTNTLAKIACGIADNLITRAASVMIKERRKLLLAPREMPFSPIALENMLKLSRLGVIIAPPVAGYYSNPESIEEMENFFVGKWLDLLGIENDLFKRWGEEDE